MNENQKEFDNCVRRAKVYTETALNEMKASLLFDARSHLEWAIAALQHAQEAKEELDNPA